MRRGVAWPLAAALAAGASALWRSRRAAAREHVDLYFDDGSMVSLVAGDADADRLLGLAHDVLSAAAR